MKTLAIKMHRPKNRVLGTVGRTCCIEDDQRLLNQEGTVPQRIPYDVFAPVGAPARVFRVNSS